MANPFVASPSSTATTEPELAITVDGWWPEIDVVDLRKSTRIDHAVTPERLRQAVVSTLCTVMDDAAAWQAAHVAAGITSLGDVPAARVAGTSVKVISYRTAVYAGVQALLLEQYRDIDTTLAGDRKAESLPDRTGQAWRAMRSAVRDMMDRPRWTVEAL